MGKLSNHIQHWLISEFPYYNSSKSSQVQSTSSSSIGTIECKLVKALHVPHYSSDKQPPPPHELHPSESTGTGVWLHQGTIGQRHGQQPQATCHAGRRFSHGNGIMEETSRPSASTVVAQPRQQQGGDDDDCPSGRDYSYRHGRLHPLLSIRHHTSLCQRMYKCSSFAMTGSLACSRQPPRFSPGRSKAQRRHHGKSWHTLELPLIS